MQLHGRGLGLLLAGGLLTGCAAKAAPLVPTGLPALEAPIPPARVVVPPPEQATVPPAEEPPPATTEVKPNRPRETPPPRPATPPATEPPVDPPVTQPPPAPVLSTTANTTNFEKRVRDRLTQAQADLAQVNRLSLGTDARAQYDSAVSFIRQAEAALKVKNLVYAGQLADKAATMAALLRRIARP